jgi:hypothetical protein
VLAQDIALAVVIACVASLVVAFVRLASGVPSDSVARQVRATLLVGALPLVVVGAALAILPDDVVRSGIGMVDVSGGPSRIERIGRLRIVGAAGAIAGLALLRFAARRGGEALRSLVDRCSPDAQGLARQVRVDARSARRQFGTVAIVVALAATVLAAAVARLQLVTQPMGFDESITYVYFAVRSPLDILTDYTIPNNHVLHSLLVHLAARVGGASEFAVRAPALVAGVLLAPASAWMALRLFGARAAPFAAALVAAEPGLVEFSVQARGYTLLALFVVLATVALSYALEGDSRSAWVIYGLAMAGGLFAVPTAVMAFYAAGAWVLLSPFRSRRVIVRFAIASAAAGVLALVLYAPTIACSGPRSLVANPYVRVLQFPEVADRAARTWRTVVSHFAAPLSPAAVGAFLLCVAAGAVAGSRGRRPGARLLISLAAALLFVAVGQRMVPPARTLLLGFPYVAAVAAYGAVTVLERVSPRPVVAAIAVVASVVVPAGWMAARNARAAEVAASASGAGVVDFGADGVNCWADGYFADAEAVAVWTSGATSSDRPLVIHVHSGMSETVRFYLCRLGVPLIRVHPFRPDVGLRQLDAHDEVLVLRRLTPAGRSDMQSVSTALEVPLGELESLFEPPEVVARLSISEIVLLRRRTWTAAFRARDPRPIDLLESPR